jgi:23S rRNA G2445 N2-methylase RlmL
MRIISVLSIAIILASSLANLSGAQAAPKTNGTKVAISAIRENALAVQQNAAIYQWKRVNLEVDRIASVDIKIQATMGSDTDAIALNTAIHSLRKARLDHNSEAAVDAAKSVAEICNRML